MTDIFIIVFLVFFVIILWVHAPKKAEWNGQRGKNEGEEDIKKEQTAHNVAQRYVGERVLQLLHAYAHLHLVPGFLKVGLLHRLHERTEHPATIQKTEVEALQETGNKRTEQTG